MKSYKDNIFKSIARFLIHPKLGKLFGITIIAIPLLLVIFFVLTNKINIVINIYSFIWFIILTYIGLFLGGYFHELGHLTTLQLMGFNSKIKIIINPHSKLIFFNMKTVIDESIIELSTSNRLLIRGMGGFWGNLLFYFIFIFIGLKLLSFTFLYFAAIQGFSMHGATSLAKSDGDTDVRSLRESLAITDELEVIKRQNKLIIKAYLNIMDNITNNYWILLDDIELIKYQGDFLLFDMGSRYLFLIDDLENKEKNIFHANILFSNGNNFKIITKTGKEKSDKGEKYEYV